MHRLPRICLIVLGVMAILVGMLHLSVHVKELVTSDVAERLSFDIMVMGKPAEVYRMWQGFSFSMGASFVVIGLFTLAHAMARSGPSIAAYVIVIGVQVLAIYSGLHYFGDEQFYGGIVGLVIALIGLTAIIKTRS